MYLCNAAEKSETSGSASCADVTKVETLLYFIVVISDCETHFVICAARRAAEFEMGINKKYEKIGVYSRQQYGARAYLKLGPTSFWRRRSGRRVATGRCLSGRIPLCNDDRRAACRELGRGLASCPEEGGDGGPAPPLSALGRRRLSPWAARWIQGREGGNAARGRAAWMVKGSGDRRLWRRLARAPEAGAGRPAGPIFRPGGVVPPRATRCVLRRHKSRARALSRVCV